MKIFKIVLSDNKELLLNKVKDNSVIISFDGIEICTIKNVNQLMQRLNNILKDYKSNEIRKTFFKSLDWMEKNTLSNNDFGYIGQVNRKSFNLGKYAFYTSLLVVYGIILYSLDYAFFTSF